MANGLIDRFCQDGRVELIGDYARWVPLFSLTGLLGVTDAERVEFRRIVTVLSDQYTTA